MKIYEALDLKEKAFISLVGAGGKSTLFSRLAEELLINNKRGNNGDGYLFAANLFSFLLF